MPNIAFNKAASALINDRTLVKFFEKGRRGEKLLGFCPTKFVKAGSQFEDSTAKIAAKDASTVKVYVRKAVLERLGIELIEGARYRVVEVCADKRIFRLEPSDLTSAVTDEPVVTVTR